MRHLEGNTETRDGHDDAANAQGRGLDGASPATPHPQTAPESAGDLALAASRGMSRHPDATEAPQPAPDRVAPNADPRLPDAPALAEPGLAAQRRAGWLTLADVAEELSVSTRTVMRWVERGELPAVVLPGGRKRVHDQTLTAWLRTREIGPHVDHREGG
jgi:excisionase family DNA binding protein